MQIWTKDPRTRSAHREMNWDSMGILCLNAVIWALLVVVFYMFGP